MKKSELKDLMDRYNILECELEDVINFIADLLYFQRREIEKNEPYARNSINRIMQAEYEVNDLLDYIEVIEEG